jgi:hypothetical protein
VFTTRKIVDCVCQTVAGDFNCPHFPSFSTGFRRFSTSAACFIGWGKLKFTILNYFPKTFNPATCLSRFNRVSMKRTKHSHLSFLSSLPPLSLTHHHCSTCSRSLLCRSLSVAIDFLFFFTIEFSLQFVCSSLTICWYLDYDDLRFEYLLDFVDT